MQEARRNYDKNDSIFLYHISIFRHKYYFTRLDRLQNKYTNYKGIKNNINFGQITGVQEKLDTTCKYNAS